VEAVAVPEVGTTATVEDLTVVLEGAPEVGSADLAFTVTRAGAAVEPEPYLGARGHLVAFRTDDLAYLHVHPHDGDAGPVRFTATFATAGSYRLFLDLQVDGEVRTAAFTVEVPDADAEPAAEGDEVPDAGPAAEGDRGDDHDHDDDQDDAGGAGHGH
jgi:hypothetical protein